MRKILAQCPRCKSRFKVIAEKVAGKKLRCIACKQAFRVPASAVQFVAKTGSARSKSARPEDEIEDYDGLVELLEDDGDEDLGGVEIVGDIDEFSIEEYDDYEEPIQRRKPVSALPMQAGRKKAEQPRSVEDEDDDDSSGGNTKLLVAAISLGGVLVIGGVIYGAVKVFPNIKLGSGVEAPAQYETYEKDDVPFLCEYPTGWDFKAGGGSSGVPNWARFESGSTTISIRESVRGAAFGDMAGQQMGVEKEIPPEFEPVAIVHEEQKERIADEYAKWDEEPPLKIVTKFGSSIRRAEFTAVGKGPFGRTYKGYRATLLNNITSFNVVCICPEKDFNTLKPAFERVIASIQAK
ncbi:MAG: MJ0042-type zinc finger domain-containing protein [Planctomycetaceae bacterium]